MSFSDDIRKFVQHANGNADKVVREVVFGVGTSLDYRSPVGDASYWQSPPPPGYVGGHFRSNWQLGIGSCPVGIVEGTDFMGSFARETAKIPQKAAGQVYYWGNNLPYGPAIEDGWSWHQAPYGVVALTKVEFQDMVSRAAGELK
jgi:hypothetical protein